MAIKKSELYSSLWASCDELRGGMDASQYKDYVLVLLFVKYVSDKNSLAEIPQGGSFKDMIALKGKGDIGDKINVIIGKLAEANGLTGIITVADFDDEEKLGKGKEMVDRLSNLVAIFENPALDFTGNSAEGDDILGDAYEYLMRHFATQSGKSKGQFYTPAEVSRVLAKVIGINQAKNQKQTLYDPTCGSSSLLLKAADEAPNGITIYGQEMDNATRALAVMNMWLHDMASAEILQGNTLASPHFTDKHGYLQQFDFIVANPPFSSKNWSNGVDVANDVYGRFKGFGVPPAKNGDYAFMLHILRSLKSNGKGAVILPHGVLFRGNAEAAIRKSIIERGYIKGIIGLPANLFYGTGIPACIVVLDKENAEERKSIFMVDASKGFIKDGNKNRLREQDIHKMVDAFNKQLNVEKYSRVVPLKEIVANEYNLNIPRYIDSQEEEDIQDIEAHLLGDIPKNDIVALQQYWDVFPAMKNTLLENSHRAGYSRLKVEAKLIRLTIFGHKQFVQYAAEVHDVFLNWQKRNVPKLKQITVGDHPKRLIHDLSENLLASFDRIALIENYQVYQHLMNYWNETMQDDVYILVLEGWSAGMETEFDTKKKDWEGRLIPKKLLIEKYFATEQKAVDQLQAEMDALTAQLQELEEEYAVEDGLLEEAKNEKGKLTKAGVQKRLKEVQNTTAFVAVSIAAEPLTVYGNEEEEPDEEAVLITYLTLMEDEAKAKKKVTQTQDTLDTKAKAKYKILAESEVKKLVVEDKWMAHVNEAVRTEIDNISQSLAKRIVELADRYANPLPEIDKEVKRLEKKVSAHLMKMGFE